MEHEEAPAALAAVGASSSLDLFDFESEVNGNNYVGGQSIGGRMFADGRTPAAKRFPSSAVCHMDRRGTEHIQQHDLSGKHCGFVLSRVHFHAIVHPPDQILHLCNSGQDK